MSEMVERVARIIFEEAMYSGTWSGASPGLRDKCFDIARTAIAAMREPTLSMLMAANDLPGAAPWGDPLPVDLWRSMIDEALK